MALGTVLIADGGWRIPFFIGCLIVPLIFVIRRSLQETPDFLARRLHPSTAEIFRISQAAAVAFIEGAGGEKQFSDRAVTDPAVVALRRKVVPVVTPGIAAAQVDMTVTLTDGRTLHRFIEHAIGSVEKPMSDAQLAAKFTDLAKGILPEARTRRLLDLCRALPDLRDAAEVARAGSAQS